MYQLRNYQQWIYDSIKKVFAKIKKIVVVAPTRSGKTILFSKIAKKFESAGYPVLILTHRQEIFDQTLDKLSEFEISVGQIKTGKMLTKNLIQLGMIQTVGNLIKKQDRIEKSGFKKVEIIQTPSLILIDEGHHATSKTWRFVLEYYNDVPRICFTATPERLDGSGLVDLFDVLITGKSTQWMIDNHWLSKPVHLCPPSPLDKENLKVRMGDYDKKSQSEIMKKHVVCGEVVKDYRKFFNGAPVIAFCCTIDHAEKMTIAYLDDGWKAIVIHGKLTRKQRDDAMDGFRNGKYQVLISVDLIGEGVDVPACAGVQLLRKTKSLALYLQMSARGLTPIYADGFDLEDPAQRAAALAAGKPESIILDHAGNYWIHGKITRDRDWSINHKKRDSKKIVTIKKVTCPDCEYSWEFGTKICPNCGFSFEAAIKKQKEFEFYELKETLININEIESENVDALTKTILRIKDYKNKNACMYAILNKKIEESEGNMKNKIRAMCDGLDYNKFYHNRVWDYLRSKHGEKLDKLA